MKFININLIIYFGFEMWAAAQQYEGSITNVPVRFDLTGSYGGQSILDIPAKFFANVTLTPSTILYNSYYIETLTSPTVTLTQRFPVAGTFEFRTITTTLTLHPFVQRLSAFGPACLTYAYGSMFFIDTQPGFTGAAFEGDYQISGPNQTVTGTFNVTLPPFSDYRPMPNQQLDVSAYSRAVVLGGTPHFTGSATIFSGIVDRISLNIKAAEFRDESDPHLLLLLQPPLFISLVGNTARISWTTNAFKLTLEYAASLPTSNWFSVTNGVAITGDQYSVTLDANARRTRT